MSNFFKINTPYETLKESKLSPDILLRRAIILQAIIDATNSSSSRKLKKLEIQAKSWIFSLCNDFTQTCLEAKVEPNAVLKIVKKILNTQKKISKNDNQFLDNSNFLDSKSFEMENF